MSCQNNFLLLCNNCRWPVITLSECLLYPSSPDSTELPPGSPILCSIHHLLPHFFCWQLLGWTAICSYLCSLNPIVNILILSAQPFQWCEFRSWGGRWAEVNRSKASWGPQPKHTSLPSCFFLLLASIWGGFSFGIKNRSQLAVCLLLSGQTQYSGRGWYRCM
jgi:hypothetical protein